MQPDKDIEIRSEEVQEILGTPPSWLVRWGSTLALATLVILGWIGFLIPYPDSTEADIRVSSTDPPRKILAERSAFISELKAVNEDTVSASELLIVFENKANYADVLTLEDHIIRVKDINVPSIMAFRPPPNLILGELQDAYYAFMEKQEAYTSGRSGKFDNLTSSQLRDQLRKEQSALEWEKKRKESLEKQLALVKNRFTREQNLMSDNLSSIDKVHKLEEEVLTSERMVQGSESNIKTKQIEIQLIKGQISSFRRGSDNNLDVANRELLESFGNLRNRLEEWTKQYLVRAPVDGVVILSNDAITEKQYVSTDMELMTIVPVKRKEIVGKGQVKLVGSGKVKVGNDVIVKFDSYPYEEFGVVRGVVSKKSKLASDGEISIEVTFPKGMLTSTGRVLEAGQNAMTGKAQVITDRKKLIEWLFEKVRNTFI